LLIHIVVWKPLGGDTKTPTVDYKKWSVFRGGNKWNQIDLEGTRIYGSHQVALLAVHWTQAVDASNAAIRAAVKTMSPDLSDPQVDTAVAHHLMDISSGNLGNFSDPSGSALKKIGDTVYVHGFPPDAPVTYRLEITGKLPAPLADLAAIATGVAHNNKMSLPNRPVTVWQGQLFTIQKVPSDIVARLLFDTLLTELDN
jgi:hypothetical protein